MDQTGALDTNLLVSLVFQGNEHWETSQIRDILSEIRKKNKEKVVLIDQAELERKIL